MKSLFFAAILLTSNSVFANDYDEIVERAFAAFDNDFSERWSYTESSERKAGVFVAQFDPRRQEDERWSLESVDGRAPTDDEKTKFLKRKSNQRDEKSADDADDQNGAGTVVAAGTVTLLEDTEEYWLLSFRPTAESDDDAEFMSNVDGSLKIVKDGHYVASIHLSADEPFKPAKGVKVSAFDSRMTFAPVSENGPVLPLSVDMEVKGRAYLLVEIDERESIRYSDFKRVAD